VKGKKDLPLSRANVQYLLKNPTYYGLIRYDGEVFEGAHEPMREFIIEANQREKVVETGDPKNLLSFFKNIGSNFLLQDKTLRFQWAQPHFC